MSLILVVLIVMALFACIAHAARPNAVPLWISVLLLILIELFRLLPRA